MKTILESQVEKHFEITVMLSTPNAYFIDKLSCVCAFKDIKRNIKIGKSFIIILVKATAGVVNNFYALQKYFMQQYREKLFTGRKQPGNYFFKGNSSPGLRRGYCIHVFQVLNISCRCPII
jgi:hypothetical protein